MELAKSNFAAVDWAQVRGWFAKANHADTENAEPLMLYYQSFVAAGERPTQSAIKGLMYALVLAPQDQRVRWMAVRQLVADGRLDEAKHTLGPIAFDPHVEASRDEAEQVLAAIDSRDAAKALTLIDRLEQEWKQD
jgi:hypothetical protein